MSSNVILFGGSFDPIHNGHLKVALSAFEQLHGDRLIFIPASRSPHKKQPPVASQSQRIEMIRLSIQDYSGFEVSDCEFSRQDPSYTLDTVRYFRNMFGSNVNLYWLVGADTVSDLSGWYEIEVLIQECFLTVMKRGGVQEPDFSEFSMKFGEERAKTLMNGVISTPLIDISSTEIRKRIASGEDYSAFLPPKVYDFIKKYRIYY